MSIQEHSETAQPERGDDEIDGDTSSNRQTSFLQMFLEARPPRDS